MLKFYKGLKIRYITTALRGAWVTLPLHPCPSSWALWPHKMNTQNENTVIVFQARRKNLISSAKMNIPTLVLGIILMFLVGDLEKSSPINSWIIGLVGFFLFSLGIVFITWKIITVYRCPQCNEVPMRSLGFLGTGGFGIKNWVVLNPQVCPSCGVQLK